MVNSRIPLRRKLIGLTVGGLLGVASLGAAAAPAHAADSTGLQVQDGSEVTATAWLTAYGWYDQPFGPSGDISHPVVHASAGGTGTYDDPITAGTGWSLASGQEVMDVPAGTRIYLHNLKVYAIVEDTCGNAPDPENQSCHDLSAARADSGDPSVQVHFDLWIGGNGNVSVDTARACQWAFTRVDQVTINAGPGLPVDPGPIMSDDGTCRF